LCVALTNPTFKAKILLKVTEIFSTQTYLNIETFENKMIACVFITADLQLSISQLQVKPHSQSMIKISMH